MKLEKAIEALEADQEGKIIGSQNDWKKATRLGIEALKRIKGRRDLNTGWEKQLLSGETED